MVSEKAKELWEFRHHAQVDLIRKRDARQPILEVDDIDQRTIDAGWERKIIANTHEELQSHRGQSVMVMGASHKPGVWPGSIYRGTGIQEDGEEWYDLSNEYNVGSDDIMLPAWVFFTPESEDES